MNIKNKSTLYWALVTLLTICVSVALAFGVYYLTIGRDNGKPVANNVPTPAASSTSSAPVVNTPTVATATIAVPTKPNDSNKSPVAEDKKSSTKRGAGNIDDQVEIVLNELRKGRELAHLENILPIPIEYPRSTPENPYPLTVGEWQFMIKLSSRYQFSSPRIREYITETHADNFNKDRARYIYAMLIDSDTNLQNWIAMRDIEYPDTIRFQPVISLHLQAINAFDEGARKLGNYVSYGADDQRELALKYLIEGYVYGMNIPNAVDVALKQPPYR